MALPSTWTIRPSLLIMPSTRMSRPKRFTAIPPCPLSTLFVPVEVDELPYSRTVRPGPEKLSQWAVSSKWWPRICSFSLVTPTAMLMLLLRAGHAAILTTRRCTLPSSKFTVAGFKICSTIASVSRSSRTARVKCKLPDWRNTRLSIRLSFCRSLMPGMISVPPTPPKPMTPHHDRMPFVRCCSAIRRPLVYEERCRWWIWLVVNEVPIPNHTIGRDARRVRRSIPVYWLSRSASGRSMESWPMYRTVPPS
mmetsp:Transcript_21086/g.45958  ORF Transcript_21086/g.45958 Transcript_21086/m.45958 type:complete len:251 (-) Transcript_21086:779-1531(-)